MQNQFLPLETSAEVTPYVAPSTTPPTVPALQEAETQNEEVHIEDLKAEVRQTPTSIQVAADLLARTKTKLRHRRKRFWAGMAVAGGMYLLTNILIGITWRLNTANVDNSLSYFYAIALLPLLLAVIPMAWMALVPVDVDFEELARSGNVSAIPMLIDSINMNVTVKYRKRVTRALTALLPLLKASDANLLTPLHRYTLNVNLGACYQPHLRGMDEDFTLAILKAYEQIGDEKAIAVVERISNHNPRDASQGRIQQAALECLPLLRANIGQVDSTQTLLRASERQTDAPNMLLRPAAASSLTPVGELLRPTQNEDLPSSTNE